nr:MAG TPA: hypothetical protein [Bacteriophage sp.]
MNCRRTTCRSNIKKSPTRSDMRVCCPWYRHMAAITCMCPSWMPSSRLCGTSIS